MADVAKGSVLLTPRFDNLTSTISDQLNGAFSGASKIGGKAGADAGSGFSSGLSAKAGAVMGLVAGVTRKAFDAISNSLGSAINRVDTMNNFPKVMKNLGYSSDDATASIKKMSASIDGLPTSLPALTGMVQQLAPLCGGLDEATNIGIAFNDMCLASGASAEDVSRAMQQYSQILSKGIPDMQDWKSLQEVMPGQLNQVAKSLLGTTANSKDLYSALKDGTVSMDDFNEAVMKLDNEGVDGFASFAQQAKDATQGIGTAWDNVPNRISKALQKVVDAIGASNISGAINKFSSSFSVIGDAAAAGITHIKGAVEDAIGYVRRFIGMIQRLDASFGTISALGRNFEIIGRAMRGVFDPAVSAVRRAIGAVRDFAGEKFTSTWPEDLALKVKGAADSVNEFIDKTGGITVVCDSIRDAFVRVLGAAAGLLSAKVAVTGLLTGIEKFKAAREAVKGFATAAKSGIGNVAALSSMISGDMAGAFTAASNPISGVFAAIKSVGGAIATLVGPVGIVIGVIAALAAGFAYMMTTNDGFRNSVMQAVSALASGLSPVISAVGATIQTLMPTLISLFGSIASVVTGQLLPALGNIGLALLQVIATIAPLIAQIISAVLPVAAQVIQVVMQVAQVILGVLVVAVNAISAVVEAVWPFVLSVFTVACAAISALISTVWPLIESIVTTTMNVISAIIETVLAAINGDWDGVWNGIKNIAKTVWDGIGSIVDTAITTVQNVLTTVLNVISGVWSNTWDTVRDFAEVVWGRIEFAVNSAINQVSGVISSVLGNISSTWSSMWGSIKGACSSIWEGIKSAASNGINSVYRTVTSIKGKITGFFSGARSWLFNSGKSILNGLKDGIMSAIGSVTSAVSGAVSRIRSFFPFSPAKVGPFSGHGYTTYSGKALMQGWAQGIGSGTGSVVSAINGAMDDARGALTTGIAVEPAVAYTSMTSMEGRGEVLSGILDILEQIRDKDGSVYLDSEKVSSALALRGRHTLAGRGYA